MASVTIDGFPAAVKKILEKYKDQVQVNNRNVVQAVSRKGAALMRAEAASKVKGGPYASSWTSKVESTNVRSTGVIYSRKPGLPHLLEHGHALHQGGRTRARVHVAPVEEIVTKEMVDQLKVKL